MGWIQSAVRVLCVILTFCVAFLIGAVKGVLVGAVAAPVQILGNIGILLGLFPAHLYWAIYTLFKTDRLNAALKLVLLFIALPVLIALWLLFGIVGIILVGVGYGVFTPWISTLEAFRQSCNQEKFLHCITDGTWGTIKGSTTVVRDFADVCYHSYPLYLKELRQNSSESQPLHTIRFRDVPACVLVGLIGIIIEIPLYTIIALVKSPYMLIKGWQRLTQDLISREGIFSESSCVPIAGLAILFWPLVVIGSILLAFFSSIFVGLYGSFVVYQESSFRRGVYYLLAMVSEFDEYTNDWLYLREGSILPKPKYRKKKVSQAGESEVGSTTVRNRVSLDPPAILIPSLAPSRSVREVIQEVKMIQIWESCMKSMEIVGKTLLDDNVITRDDLSECLRTKSAEADIVGIGLPSYSLLLNLLDSISERSDGIILNNGVVLNYWNRPQDRLMDWFFQPIMVLKEQIKVIEMGEGEAKFLEKLILLGGGNKNNIQRDWDNGAVVPQDPLIEAQIQAISRRLVGITVSVSKFPTYRRRYRQVVKNLIAYSFENGGCSTNKENV
ncbi:unknownprotein [Zostera marina]|uniref:Uncharacterized protein n=1 Tax=Zostera marina TaxID=29655 RepID=A0A0K9PFJ4_ZOSMR|nr:unknownprotein [Zostera marina]